MLLSRDQKNTQVRIYLLLIAALSFYCLDFFFRISQSIVVAPLIHQYQISALGIGGFASAFYLGYAVMQIPAGMLLDAYPFNRIFALSIFICVICFVGFVWGQHYWFGYSMRLLVGAASALSFIGVLYIARCFIPRQYFSLIAGIAIAIGTLAASGVQVIGAFLIEHLDWHVIFTAIALLALLIGVIILLPGFSLIRQAATRQQSFSLHKVLFLLKQPTFLINGFIGSLFYLPTTIFASLWGVPFLQQVYQYTETKASFGIMLLFLGWAIGSPMVGYIAGKRSCAWVLVIVGASIGCLISLLLIYTTLLIEHGMLLIFLFGVASSSQTAVWAVFEETCPTGLSAMGIALTNMIIMLGGTVFHLIVGLLLSYGVFNHDEAFNYHLGLSLIPASFAIVALLGAITHWRTLRKKI
jgi:MFS family permease